MKRRELWVRLWLARLLAFLCRFGGALESPQWRNWFDRSVDAIAKGTMQLVFIRASLHLSAQRVSQNRKRPALFWSDPRAEVKIDIRAAMGGALRHALRAQGPQRRLTKILDVMNRQDAHIARLVRRLRRGMTRYMSKNSRTAALANALECVPLLGLNQREDSTRPADTS